MNKPGLLCIGDHFILPELMRSKLGSLESRFHVTEASTPFPLEPYRDIAEVREASGSEEQMIEVLHGVSVCIAHHAPLTRRVLEHASNLELFIVCRGGPVNVNLAAATAKNVLVGFTPARNAAATAEHAVALILSALRGIPKADASLHNGDWKAVTSVDCLISTSRGGMCISTPDTDAPCIIADVAFAAGVPTQKGDDGGGLQPPTLMFCLAGVDTEELRMAIAQHPKTYMTDFIPNDYFGQNRQFIVVGLKELIREAQAKGFDIPTERTIVITGLRQGEAWINMTRIRGVDGTDLHSLTRGEIEGRRQIADIQRYLQEYVPGFKQSYFTKTAPFLGIRETRRILGHYVMDRDDILSCRRFEDAIAVASYPIDLHRPNDKGCTLEWCGDCYDIPYRSLVPQAVDNLLVAGRCISTTHEAMAAIRVMATCMAMGEAAGRAAAMCAADNLRPRDVDIAKLRRDLLAGGAYLREPSSAAEPASAGAATGIAVKWST